MVDPQKFSINLQICAMLVLMYSSEFISEWPFTLDNFLSEASD